jgi:hypothetical protein
MVYDCVHLMHADYERGSCLDTGIHPRKVDNYQSTDTSIASSNTCYFNQQMNIPTNNFNMQFNHPF